MGRELEREGGAGPRTTPGLGRAEAGAERGEGGARRGAARTWLESGRARPAPARPGPPGPARPGPPRRAASSPPGSGCQRRRGCVRPAHSWATSPVSGRPRAWPGRSGVERAKRASVRARRCLPGEPAASRRAARWQPSPRRSGSRVRRGEGWRGTSGWLPAPGRRVFSLPGRPATPPGTSPSCRALRWRVMQPAFR